MLFYFVICFNIYCMRTIYAKDIENKLEKVIYDTATTLAKDAVDGISKALAKEDSERAKFAMNVLLENAEVANKEAVPLCQDTGMAVFFVELGQDVHIEGSLHDALNRAPSKAYSASIGLISKPSLLISFIAISIASMLRFLFSL